MIEPSPAANGPLVEFLVEIYLIGNDIVRQAEGGGRLLDLPFDNTAERQVVGGVPSQAQIRVRTRELHEMEIVKVTVIVAATEIERKIRIERETRAPNSPELPGAAVDQRIVHLLKIIDIGNIADDKWCNHLIAQQQKAGGCAVLGEIESFVARRGDHSRIG